jgi:ribonuclease D
LIEHFLDVLISDLNSALVSEALYLYHLPGDNLICDIRLDTRPHKMVDTKILAESVLARGYELDFTQLVRLAANVTLSGGQLKALSC